MFKLLKTQTGLAKPKFEISNQIDILGNTDLGLVLVPLTLLLPMFGSTLVPKRVSSCPEAFEALG